MVTNGDNYNKDSLIHASSMAHVVFEGKEDHAAVHHSSARVTARPHDEPVSTHNGGMAGQDGDRIQAVKLTQDHATIHDLAIPFQEKGVASAGTGIEATTQESMHPETPFQGTGSNAAVPGPEVDLEHDGHAERSLSDYDSVSVDNSEGKNEDEDVDEKEVEDVEANKRRGDGDGQVHDNFFSPEENEEGVNNQDKVSEMNESMSSFNSAEAREAAIRGGFISFLIGYIQGVLFQKFMGAAGGIWFWFLKKTGLATGEDENGGTDLAEEIVDAANPGALNITGGGFGGPMPTPTGGGGFGAGPVPPGVPVGPPPGVVEMAAAASQSAASASAAGAAGASAGAAGAAAGSMAAGMAGAVASAGVAGQVGAAVGVAAVTAAAVSSGLYVQTNATKPVPPPPYMDTFVPPSCSAATVLKSGFVEMHIGGLPPLALPAQKGVMEILFRDIYNTITGMCLDPFARVLYSATIDTWEMQWANESDHLVFESNTATAEEKQQVIKNSVLTTNWIARVACEGCPDREPLFQPGEQAMKQHRHMSAAAQGSMHDLHHKCNRESHAKWVRRLEMMSLELEEFFPFFVAAYENNIPAALSSGIKQDVKGNLILRPPVGREEDDNIAIVFATTLQATPNGPAKSANGTKIAVATIGREEIEAMEEALRENNGAIETPFVDDKLENFEASLQQCMNATTGQVSKSTFCQAILNNKNPNINPTTVAFCLENLMEARCQEILPELLDVMAKSQEKGDPLAVTSPPSQNPTNADTEEPTQTPISLTFDSPSALSALNDDALSSDVTTESDLDSNLGVPIIPETESPAQTTSTLIGISPDITAPINNDLGTSTPIPNALGTSTLINNAPSPNSPITNSLDTTPPIPVATSIDAPGASGIPTTVSFLNFEAPGTPQPNTGTPGVTDVQGTIATGSHTPSTGLPVLNAPNSNAPDTTPPISVTPMSSAPISSPPTTIAPVAGQPSTNIPGSTLPATNIPATVVPDITGPDTNTPITNTPVTVPPITNIPVTNVPTTNAHLTNTPINDIPATNAPVTGTPGTTGPDTNIPITNAPTISIPITSPPGTNAPFAIPTGTNSPIFNAPVTTDPFSTPPAPLTNFPITDKPITSPPGTFTGSPETPPPISLNPTVTPGSPTITPAGSPIIGTPTVTIGDPSFAPISGSPATPPSTAPTSGTPTVTLGNPSFAPISSSPVIAQSGSPSTGTQTMNPSSTISTTTAPVTGSPSTLTPTVDCVVFRLELLTDLFGSETSWKLQRWDACDGNSLTVTESGGSYASSTSYLETRCIDDFTKYTFTIFDSNGDGICCRRGSGSYSIYYNGAFLKTGGEYTTSDVTTFGTCTTSSPTSLAPNTVAPTIGNNTTRSPANATPTTSSPTSFAPTTEAPTMGANRTRSPATATPNTTSPLNLAPTTSPPTMGANTTRSPAITTPNTTSPLSLAPITVPPIRAPTKKPSTSPTSVGSKTVSPTSRTPTTESPTTATPTTGSPTSLAPTTIAPTTGSTTTKSPTTATTTTVSPTSLAPITIAPTTGAPTTESPATSTPTTGSPTSLAPITMAPTIGAPTTESPTTATPTSSSPTSLSPTTEAPTTGAPITEGPTTSSPTSLAPITAPPITGAPITESPTTATPTTSNPTSVGPTLLCSTPLVDFIVELNTDDNPLETSWLLKKWDTCDGSVLTPVESNLPYTVPNDFSSQSLCIYPNARYTFTISDSGGNGLCCGFGFGAYNIYFDGVSVGSGSAFLGSQAVDFGTCTSACSSGLVDFVVQLTTDDNPVETSWLLEKWDTCDGSVLSPVVSNLPYTVPNEASSQASCIDPNAKYTFTISDAGGNGLCCGFGSGLYNLFVDGVNVAAGSVFGSSDDVVFGNAWVDFKLELHTDDNPLETSWLLEKWDTCDGSVLSPVVSNLPYTVPNERSIQIWCIDPNAKYTFTISDSGGNGLCCGFGNGWYNVIVEYTIKGSGSSFTTSEQTIFGTCI